MIAWLAPTMALALPLCAAGPSTGAELRAGEDPPPRRSREDVRHPPPRIHMGAGATGFAFAAFIAAVVARRLRRRAA